MELCDDVVRPGSSPSPDYPGVPGSIVDTGETATGGTPRDVGLNGSTDSGDYETLARRSQRTTRQKEQTVFGVTADARKVLERFLQMKDETSPYATSAVVDLEPQYAVVGEVYQDQQPTPYQHMGSEESLCDAPPMRGARAGKEERSAEEGDAAAGGEEPDYVDCQMLLERSRAPATLEDLILLQSGGVSDVKTALHPPKVKSKVKVSKKTSLEASLSSSTEDYEYTDNELLNRKKKSFFRWASERLQQGFRRHVKKMASSGEDGTKVVVVAATTAEQQRAGGQEQEFFSATKSYTPLPFPPMSGVGVGTARESGKTGLRRDGSEKSSSTPSEAVAEPLAPTLASLHVPGADLDADEKRKRSPMLWRRSEKKRESVVLTMTTTAAAEEKGKERGMFGGILRQFRRGSAKLKRKDVEGTRKHRSRSADGRLTKEDKKRSLLYEVNVRERFGLDETEYESDGVAVRYRRKGPEKFSATPPFVLWETLPEPPLVPGDDAEPYTGSHCRTVRHPTYLEGLVSCRPASSASSKVPSFPAGPRVPSRTSMPPKIHLLNPNDEIERNPDEIDGVSLLDLGKMLVHSSTRPFSEKSEKEKDELYERIAEQLAAIADHYHLESPESAKSSSSPSIPSPPPPEDQTTLADALAKNSGDTDPQAMQPDALVPINSLAPKPIVAELVQNASYGKFKELVNEDVGVGVGWQQIARMFRLTQSAVQLAGMGTSVALQIKEMSLKYFEDRFADWIVDQGGWESMVEDTNTEQDSELD